MIKGKVIQFRRSLKHVHERHFILDFGTKNKLEAKIKKDKLISCKKDWKERENR